MGAIDCTQFTIFTKNEKNEIEQMSNLRSISLKNLGYNFIDKEYIAAGNNEYSQRFKQIKQEKNSGS